jgi:LacI family transcriptional regulator
MDSLPRANLHDVARAAGVSLATVDRVLHGRAGVHARTVERVNAVVEQLGYRPDPAAARLARKRSARLAFVLPAGTNSFVGLLNQQVQAIAPWLAEQRAGATVQLVDVFSPAELAQHLAGLQGRFDAVVVMALDHPQVRAAIDDLVAHGSVVVTLVSDMGSRALRDHAERLFGFEQVMSAEHPHLLLLPAIEGQDRSERTEPLVAKLLKKEPDLAGLYSIGAGNRGIQAALAASGRAQHVSWVCHELTAHARRALLDGVADAVINQDAGHEVRSACRLALAALSGERVLPDQERIRIDIFLKDNLP